ncbi:DUF2521 family protein [Alkalicoccobacillus plakortidis]|uniref:YbaK family protein n=1 Tax=Alkalicoccobacillus plakortidis TaxID=444060 RepID=A0ABT0XPB0_9BACI|nr:DUF2521 family protein [Alkalicoccobacillus plakortidis]MCM2677647.1 YbaK family protein [Alkalicoccobacillus plakortidis]
MEIITTLADKRREKRWNFERKLLQEISLKDIEKQFHETFAPVIPKEHATRPFLVDPSLDIGIDAYLLGANYSRFFQYGESEQQAKSRAEDELTDLSFDMFNLLTCWVLQGERYGDALGIASDVYVDTLWQRGFQAGTKRYRLKLH